jgi:Family of unknown function (DUF6088)
MSSLSYQKLDNIRHSVYYPCVRTPSENSVAGKVRKLLEKGGPGKLWTYTDFRPLPFLAVAATLSRLAKEGEIRRIRKGVYYSPRNTRFGELAPDATSVVAAVLKSRGVKWRSSGLPAYNGLGLTTQVSPILTVDVPVRIYSLTTGSNTKLRLRPRTLVDGLSNTERAALDALRDLPRIPGSSPAETASKIRNLFAAKRLNFNKLARRSVHEPPRVKALLGAIGSELGADHKTLAALRKSLNPMTTFHLGVSEALPHAREWRIN